MASSNKLIELVHAIRTDKVEDARQNPLWENINAVLPNGETILQMCADAGALHCFWQAILAGASLENPHYQQNLHPLILALKNHQNLIAQIILILHIPSWLPASWLPVWNNLKINYK